MDSQNQGIKHMQNGLVAKASVNINAPLTHVWDALINPEMIRQYMFSTEVVSTWKEGSPIIWKGIWQGKSYQDKGVIIKIELYKMLVYSHFSALSGLLDVPKNYHTLTFELSTQDGLTSVTLSQDNNSNEKARDHSQQMWKTVLTGLKELVEKSGNTP